MKQSTTTRLLYALGFVILTILASFCMADFAQETLQTLIIGDNVCGSRPPSECDSMYGYLGVMRLTFALAVYHLALMLLTFGVTSSRHSRAKLHTSQWGLKFILLVIIVFSVWWLPNDFYLGYSYFALSFAFVFAIAQFFMLVSFADSINAHLVGLFEDTEDVKHMLRLISLTVIFGALTLTLIVLLYLFYSGAGCGVNIFMTTFTLVFILIPSALSVTSFVQERKTNIGLFQSLVVGCYASYLTWIAISGYSVDTCNEFQNEHAANLIALIPGSIFLGIALCYWTFASVTGNDEYSALLEPSAGGAAPSANTTVNSEAAAVVVDDDNDDEIAGALYIYSRFHFVMAAAAVYLSMIITNWEILERYPTPSDGAPTLVAPPIYQLSAGLPALWLKWSAGAISLLLYTFSLVAPIFFPDRDFN